MAEMMLGLTENAAHRVWHLIEEEQDDTLKLRVYITGGGCSGFQYGFNFCHRNNGEVFCKQEKAGKK